MKNIGEKCKHKNIICDGLCNNCFENISKSNSYKFASRAPYSYELPDYEELILAMQESDYD